MNSALSPLTIRLSTAGSVGYRVDLESPDVGERHGSFAPPYTVATWQAIMLALEPGFVLAEADKTVHAALKPLGDLARLPHTAGAALAGALLADEEVHLGFDVALGRAEAMRRPLPVEMRFGAGCDALAALPWELLHYRDRFLLADTSIALSRYPEGAIPPTTALGELPLRVLLVLSEPVDVSPIFPERAREELLHGLRSLDEAGAVVVDLLRPPTFSTLVEAVANGGYHMLVFYGHGGYDTDAGGLLLFEDEFGGPALIKASELGAALRNTDVRLVLLGACQSATVGAGLAARPGIWSGTAPALVRAGVPLAIGMQVSMRVDAALAFIHQFALSLAAGKPVIEAVGDARKPIIRGAYGELWYAPALYGRPAGDTRLFDPQGSLPANTADLRAEMKAARSEIERTEKAISGVGVLGQPGEIAHLRQARARFVQARAEVARRTPGDYAVVVSPLYGVPTNPIFVGRAQELHDVARAFTGEHPVVIWGTGGIGKSALAAEVAHRQSWRFPGGVLWLDCRDGPAFDSLLNQIGAFAGIEAIDKVEPDKKEMTVKWVLAGLDARCLLVWDNAEEVWDERAVRRFVEGLPANCQALLTTRENPEQAMWPTVELPPLTGNAMHDLFYRLASAAGVKAGSQADLDAIPLILDWLQGHPLALALVVPLAMKRGLQRVWVDLQARPLKGIEAAFEVSYERLTDLQRRVFTRLSVYTIPFNWPAAQALLPGERGVDDALDVLVQRALVGFDGARYGYHSVLRQYAYARLKEVEDSGVVHKLAAEYLQTKITTTARGGTPEEGLEEVDQWQSAEAWETFAKRARSLVGSLDRLGYWPEIEIRLVRASAASAAYLGGSVDYIAGLLSDRATIALKSARWAQAISLWEEVAAIYEGASNERGMAQAYNSLGLVYSDRGEWDRAIELYQQALATHEHVSDLHGLAQTYGNLGSVYARNGQWDRAIEFCKKDLAISKELGDIHAMAQSYNNLGGVYLRKGEWDHAIEFYEKDLEISEQLGDIHGIAQTYTNLGSVYAEMGEWDRAIEFHEESLATLERVGDLHAAAQTYNNLGVVYERKGEWDRAIDLYCQSLAIQERIGDIPGLATTSGNLGLVFARKGERDRAIAFYRRSLTAKELVGDIHGVAATYANLGLFYWTCGDTDQAADFAARAYLIFARLGASETQKAALELESILGSVEAANTYLARLAGPKES